MRHSAKSAFTWGFSRRRGRCGTGKKCFLNCFIVYKNDSLSNPFVWSSTQWSLLCFGWLNVNRLKLTQVDQGVVFSRILSFILSDVESLQLESESSVNAFAIRIESHNLSACSPYFKCHIPVLMALEHVYAKLGTENVVWDSIWHFLFPVVQNLCQNAIVLV